MYLIGFDVKIYLSEIWCEMNSYNCFIRIRSDNMSDRNRILCEFRNKTKSIMGDSLKQMILYGSYARGDYGDNSDMDIMVLTELTDDRIIQIEDEIFDAAYDIELEYGVPISVNIKNEKHFKNWVNSLPYYSNIQKEGIIIA